MSEDNLEINFPVPLTSQEAHLLLRAICINVCINKGIYSGVELEIEDELRMFKKIKAKLNAIIPQSRSDVMTKSKFDQMFIEEKK
jgi:hypothetical protein